MMRLWIVFAIAVTIFAAGCGPSIQFLPNEQGNLLQGRPHVAEPLVLLDGPPKRPHTLVGSILISHSSGALGGPRTRLTYFVDRFKEKAAKIGADGVTDLKVLRTGSAGIAIPVGGVAVGAMSDEPGTAAGRSQRDTVHAGELT